MTQNQSAREEADRRYPGNGRGRMVDSIQSNRRSTFVEGAEWQALRLSSGGQGSSAARIPTALPDGLLDDLERLAKAATPGGWTCKEGSTQYPECDDKDFWAAVLSPQGKEIVTIYERSSLDDRNDYDFDAAYIAAANPATVLKLIEAVRSSQVGMERSGMNQDSDHPQQQGEKP